MNGVWIIHELLNLCKRVQKYNFDFDMSSYRRYRSYNTVCRLYRVLREFIIHGDRELFSNYTFNVALELYGYISVIRYTTSKIDYTASANAVKTTTKDLVNAIKHDLSGNPVGSIDYSTCSETSYEVL